MGTQAQAIVRSADFSRYVPYRLAMSSEHLGWRGFRMEAVRGHAAGEIALPPLDHHLLNLIIAGPTRHVHRWDGAAAEQTGAQGTASLVAAGRDSYWRWSYLTPETPCDVHLHLEPAFVRRVAVQNLSDLPGNAELRSELCFSNPAVCTLATALLDEMERGGAHGTLYAESLATALVSVLLSMQEPWRRRLRPGPAALPAMRPVCDFIEENLDRTLHLDTLAALAGLGPERFRHAFRSALGDSPHRYVLRRRLERARQLLRESRLPITEIAHRLGFADHSHLTSTFRRETGVTPSRFRAEALR